MPVVSADTLRLAAVKEDVFGVTPATPAFDVWRTTGESVTFETNVSESQELGGTGRSQRPSNVTGVTVAGEINFALAKFDALTEAIAGVLANEWGECPLTGAAGGVVDSAERNIVGRDIRSYTIEKRFPNPAYVDGTFATVGVANIPGATPTITYTGAAATGTGVARVDLVIDGGQSRRFDVNILVGEDASDIALKVAALLNAEADIGAGATGGAVDLTTTGTQFDSITVVTVSDEYFYQRYTGCTYSALNLSVAPNEDVTGSVSIVAGVPTLDVVPITGATYATAANSSVFTAPEVLEISVGVMLGIGTHCWTSLNITIDSQNRGITCIGTSGERETVLGTATISLEGEIYFSSQDILQAVLDNDVVGDGAVVLSNSDGEYFRFDFPDIRFVTASLAAGGTGEDLVIPATGNPTPKVGCSDAGEDWTTGVVVSTVSGAPTWP